MQDGGGSPSQPSPYRTILVTPVCPKPMRKRDVWRVDQFHLIKKIGSGYASSVYLGTCHQTGNQVAIKLYHKNKLSELNLFQVAREIRIHGALDHKNIVQMWAAFEDQFGIYIITEYASKGDVFTEVERRGGQMTEMETVRQVIYPFCSALQYLHSNDIIHRDIKPENLLFTATGVLKVGDFGLSINISQERPVTRVGTLDYMAPEVVICPDKHRPMDNKEMTHLYYTCLVDAWAVGVLAYELIVGRPPFDKGAKKATIQEILNADPFMPPWLSEGAGHFIRWSLTKNQRDRPGVQQLMEHPWVLGHMTKANSGSTAAQQLAGLRSGFGRADSFVEQRTAGLLNNPDSPRADSGSINPFAAPSAAAAAAAGNPMLAAIKASGKPFLQHSNSMNAADAIRFRDLKFDLSPPDPQLGPMPTSAPLVPGPAAARSGSPMVRKSGAGGSGSAAPPSLERRLSNMQGAIAAAAMLAAGGGQQSHSRRQSSVNNVLTESRSRRQSGVGHSLVDPVSPSLGGGGGSGGGSTVGSPPAPFAVAPPSPLSASFMQQAGAASVKRTMSNSSLHLLPAGIALSGSPVRPNVFTAGAAAAVPWPGMDPLSPSRGNSAGEVPSLPLASPPPRTSALSSTSSGGGAVKSPRLASAEQVHFSRLSQGQGVSVSNSPSGSFTSGTRPSPLRSGQQADSPASPGFGGGGGDGAGGVAVPQQQQQQPQHSGGSRPPQHPNHHARDSQLPAGSEGSGGSFGSGSGEPKLRTFRPADPAPRSPSTTSIVPSRLSFTQASSPLGGSFTQGISPLGGVGAGSFGRSQAEMREATAERLMAAAAATAASEARTQALAAAAHQLAALNIGANPSAIPPAQPQAPPSPRAAPASPRPNVAPPRPPMLETNSPRAGAVAGGTASPSGSHTSGGHFGTSGGGVPSPSGGSMSAQHLQPGSPNGPPSPANSGNGGEDSGLFKKGIFASFKRVFQVDR